MTRGQITIEKNGKYIVYDANANEVHGVSTITTQSFNDAIRRSKRPIMMWRFREEVGNKRWIHQHNRSLWSIF